MYTRFAKIVKNKLYVVDVDNRLLPDDNFRSVFYDFYTLKDIANHIIYNLHKGFDFVEGVGEEGDYDDESKGGGFHVLYSDKLDYLI
jgi:hypothetical protein